MVDKLRINFVLPPTQTACSGSLAIMGYANQFIERGHMVSITTFPDSLWSGDHPFPWSDYKGRIHFKQMRNAFHSEPCVSAASLKLLGKTEFRALSRAVLDNFGLEGL